MALCNVGGDDFPRFMANCSGPGAIEVEYIIGEFGPVGGTGNTACGLFAGGSTKITLYKDFRASDGRILACQSCEDSISDLVAHELGHYLGLGDSSDCFSHIMGPGEWSVIGGTIQHFFDQEIQPEECSTADFLNSPPEEPENECNNLKVNPCGEPTPIIVDLDFDNFHLAGLDDAVEFDIDGDGTLNQISWTSGGTLDGFLSMDRNRNGIIDDGRELFGNATRLMSGFRAPHGFAALAELDLSAVGGNENGSVDAGDPLFPLLRVWIDWNHNAFSEEAELFRLEDIGLVSIDLSFREQRRVDQHGNLLRYVSVGWSQASSPHLRRLKIVDVIFVEIEDRLRPF